MADNNSEITAPISPRTRRRRSGWSLRLTSGGVILIIGINLILLATIAYGLSRLYSSQRGDTPGLASQPTSSHTPAHTLSPTPTEAASVLLPTLDQTTPTSTASATQTPRTDVSLAPGLILLSMDEGGNTHLFAYQPQAVEGQGLPLIRLTSGPWDDITPAISPDGTQVAFASNRNGYWDLYLLDLPSGQVSRLTDTPEYDAAPSWSPDGLWLAYETYPDNNLEIRITSISQPGTPISLTNHPASDHSPSWSPAGRTIAFVSDRSGSDEVWLADLDKNDVERFENLSNNPGSNESHPAWSPDGSQLAWSVDESGFHNLYLWKGVSGDSYFAGSGDWPIWSPDGSVLLTQLLAPNQSYLTAYPLQSPGVILPPMQLPGSLQGLTWGSVALSLPLRELYQNTSVLTATPLFIPALTAQPGLQGGRYQLVNLQDVEAPFPRLHDQVDEAFDALRARIALESGWDLLAALENAFVPLTSPLDPGMEQDWLYTGRAFAFSRSPISAGWLVVVREDFGAQTYWRVFMRARYQDGSAGMPLRSRPWDFSARYSGEAVAFEQGGKPLVSIPSGYWIDFTQRALSFSFHRLPALSTWRASYPAARFNEFALIDGLDWQSAMLELYPLEALLTPSPVAPDTRTPTPTSRWYQSPTPTFTSTPRPTFTPSSATSTPIHTAIPTPTSTSRPTATQE